ncbi:hypothetical protein H3C66_02275 [Patescibacteria group bacterium]|nr:hypothetical protein [Patescibacteria group bacterium]
MTTAEGKVLVISNEGIPAEEFEKLCAAIVEGAPVEIELLHYRVNADNAETLTEDIEELVEGDESILAVYVVADNDIVSSWFSDEPVGFWEDLNVNVETSDGFFVGYLPDDDEDEGEFDDEDTNP